MRMKEMMKNTTAKWMVLGMAGLALLGGAATLMPGHVQAAETSSKAQVRYENLYYPEVEDEIYLGETEGKVIQEYDNKVIIQTPTETKEYSFYQTGSIELIQFYKSSYMENLFDTEGEAQLFIDLNRVEVSNLVMEEGMSGDLYWCDYYIEGKLPLYTLIVKTTPNECKSLKLEANKTTIHPGETAIVSVTEMDGGSYDDLTWECPGSNVSLDPQGDVCYVTASDEVETVMVRAETSNHVSNYVHINIMN